MGCNARDRAAISADLVGDRRGACRYSGNSTAIERACASSSRPARRGAHALCGEGEGFGDRTGVYRPIQRCLTMPSDAVGSTPSLSEVEHWDTTQLSAAASYWTATADQWEDAFTQIRLGRRSAHRRLHCG